MKQMKVRVLTLVMVLMTIMASVQGMDKYWNGDPNYPLVYTHQNVYWYVDLSSAYIASKSEKVGEGYFHGEYVVKYNLITVSENEVTKVRTIPILIVHEKGGSLYYAIDEKGQKRDRLTGEGVSFYQRPYNAAIEVDNYLFK